MYDSGKKSDLTLAKIMKERRELIIALCAETPKARCGTRGRSLVSRVCGGKGTTGPQRGSKGAEVRVTLGADRVS